MKVNVILKRPLSFSSPVLLTAARKAFSLDGLEEHRILSFIPTNHG
jgi:hypothetical protein